MRFYLELSRRPKAKCSRLKVEGSKLNAEGENVRNPVNNCVRREIVAVQELMNAQMFETKYLILLKFPRLEMW